MTMVDADGIAKINIMKPNNKLADKIERITMGVFAVAAIIYILIQLL